MAKPPHRLDVNEATAALTAAATGLSLPTGVYAGLLERQKARQQAEENVVQKNPAAVALGRLGGLKGGKARAESLSPTKRRQIASNAAKKRWAVLNAVKQGRTVKDVAKTFGVPADKIREMKDRLSAGPKEGKKVAPPLRD